MTLRQCQTPWLTDVFTTADATPTNSAIAIYAPPLGSGGVVEMRVIATNAAGATASMLVSQTWKNVAATVSLVGVLNTIQAATGDAGMVAILAAFVVTGGTTLVPRVTGIALTNITWFIEVKHWAN